MSTTSSAKQSLEAVDPAWAWMPFQPDQQRPWTRKLAGHLLRRAAWGGNATSLQQTFEQGPQAAIDRLLDPDADVAAFEQQMRGDEEAVARASSIDSLAAWWLRRMQRTPFPLQEKMTLFWHSHFGVSQGRVNDALLMLRHIQTLRQHALGSYRDLLEAASQDAAVLLSVGADRNRRLQPNESFVRQLMERYSVGPGHYADEDVREAARAFTGWSVLRGRLRFLAHEHDSGAKQVLGRKGEWEAQDIVRIVLEQPATPLLIARNCTVGSSRRQTNPATSCCSRWPACWRSNTTWDRSSRRYCVVISSFHPGPIDDELRVPWSFVWESARRWKGMCRVCH